MMLTVFMKASVAKGGRKGACGHRRISRLVGRMQRSMLPPSMQLWDDV